MGYLFHPWLIGFYLMGIATLSILLCGILYFQRSREKTDYKEKTLMLGFAYLFICFAIGRLFYSITESNNYQYLTGTEADIAIFIFYLFSRIAYFFQLLGITIFIYCFEKIYQKTHYILTLINIVFLAIIIIGPYDLVLFLAATVIMYCDGFILFLILVKIIQWSQFEFRANTSLLIIGYFLVLLGATLYSSTIKYYDYFFFYFSPLLIIVGCCVIITPIIMDPGKSSHVFLFYILLSSLALGIALFLEIYFLLNYDQVYYMYWINGTVLLIFICIAFVYLIKIIKTETSTDKPVDILQMFTKPPKFTDEELAFHRKKKLCLVCKNKLSRMLYMCPECNSLYCPKCSDVLSKAENACWVCDTVFDKSKPVAVLKEEEKKVIIEETTAKGGSPQGKVPPKKK